jgi:hypothetical protein
MTVPLYTRHTRGTIEADRDRRRHSRDRDGHRYSPAAAVVRQIAPPANAALDRWANEGGHFEPDPDLAVALA